jgi:hypothetical protein
VPDENVALLASTLDCQIGSMPFTYLGLPLGTIRPSVDEYMLILTKMEKYLMGITRFFSYAGRLVLVNSIYSSIPTFYLCALKLPEKILHQIDKYRKQCLWNGGDLSKKGGCLVAWKHACRSKEGGLGIINLRTRNTALLLKFLHKFYNKANLSWVYLTWTCHYKNGKAPHERHSVGSFWWRDIMSLVEHYMMITSCKVNKGDTLCIWSDLWDCGVLQWRFPQLHCFSKTGGISVAKILSNQLERNFWLPLSTQASSQLIDFQNLITSIQRQNSENDIWSYIWGNPIFTSKKILCPATRDSASITTLCLFVEISSPE